MASSTVVNNIMLTRSALMRKTRVLAVRRNQDEIPWVLSFIHTKVSLFSLQRNVVILNVVIATFITTITFTKVCIRCNGDNNKTDEGASINALIAYIKFRSLFDKSCPIRGNL